MGVLILKSSKLSRWFLLSFILVVFSAFLNACSQRNIPGDTNDPERHRDRSGVGTNVDRTAAIGETVLSRLSSSSGSAPSKLSDSEVLDLLNDFFAPSNLRNPEFTASTSNRRALVQLLDAVKARGKPELDSAVVKAVQLDCDAQLRGCSSLRFFERDPSVAVILKRAGQSETNLLLRARLWRLAFELQSLPFDQELVDLYLSNATAFEAALGSADSEALLVHRRLVATLLQARQSVVGIRGAGNPALDGGVSGLGQWTAKSSDLRLGASEREYWQNLAKSRLYISGERILGVGASGRRSLNPDFVAAVRRVAQEPNGFLSLQSELQRNRSFAFRKLGLNEFKDADLDEWFFLVDRAFTRSVSVSSLGEVYASTNRDLAQLETSAKRYLEIVYAHMVDRVHQGMANAIKEKTGYPDLLLEEIEKANQPLVLQVRDFEDKARNVQVLLAQAAALGSRTVGADMQHWFASLTERHKYAISYPQMLVVSIYLSRFNFSKTVPVFGSYTYNIDSNTLLLDLFTGNSKIFISYLHNAEALTASQVFSSFELAFNSDVFSVFGVPPQEILETLRRRTIDVEARLIQTRLEGVRNRKSSAMGAQAIEQCRRMLAGQPLSGYSVSLSSAIGMDVSRPFGDGLLGFAKELYPATPEDYNALGRLTDIGFPLLDRLAVFGKLIESYTLERFGSADVEKLKDTLSAIEQARNLFLVYLKESLEEGYQALDCRAKLFQLDSLLRFSAFDREVEYLRSIHAEMTKLRASPVSENQLKELNIALKKAYQVEGWDTAQFFDANKLVVGIEDAYLRRAKDLVSLPLSFDGRAPVRYFENLIVTLPGSVGRTRAYWSNNQGIEVAYHSDRDTFVRQAMQKYAQDFGALSSRPLRFVPDRSPVGGIDNLHHNALIWLGRMFVASASSQSQEVERLVAGLLDQPRNLMRQFDYSEREIAIRTYLTTKYVPYEFEQNTAQMNKWLYDSSQQTIFAPFDPLLLTIATDVNSEPGEGQAVPVLSRSPLDRFLEQALKFNLVQKARLPSGVPKTYLAKLHEQVSQSVSRLQRGAELLLTKIQEQEASDRAANRLLEPRYILIPRYSGPYTSRGASLKLTGKLAEFHSKTADCFRGGSAKAECFE